MRNQEIFRMLSFKSFFEELQLAGLTPEHFIILSRKKGLMKTVAQKIMTVIMEALYDLREGDSLQYVNYNSNVEELCVAAGLQKVDSDINSQNFPTSKSGKDSIIMKISKDSALKAKNLSDFRAEEGYRLATFEESFAYLASHPEVIKKSRLLVLGSIWHNMPEFVRQVITLTDINGRTEAYLVPNNCPLKDDHATFLVKL